MRRNHAPWSFSLLEMMVAIGVAGAGIVLITQSLSQANEASRRLEQRQTAISLLEMKGAEFARRSEPLQSEGKFEPPFESYAWKARIEPTSVDGLYRLNIRVEWPGRRESAGASLEMLVPQQ